MDSKWDASLHCQIRDHSVFQWTVGNSNTSALISGIPSSAGVVCELVPSVVIRGFASVKREAAFPRSVDSDRPQNQSLLSLVWFLNSSESIDYTQT